MKPSGAAQLGFVLVVMIIVFGVTPAITDKDVWEFARWTTGFVWLSLWSIWQEVRAGNCKDKE